MPAVRIMHVVRPAAGGIRNHLLALVGESHGDRFHHMVACPPGSLEEALAGMGICTFSVPLRGEISPREDLAVLKALISIIKRNMVDVVHAHGFKAGLVGRLAAKAAGAPAVVLTVHGSVLQDRRAGWQKGMFSLSERLLAAFTDRIITVSAALGREMPGGERIRPEKIVTIYNGISPGDYSHCSDRKYLHRATGIPEGKKVVGTVARLAPQKGVECFIRAASIVAGKQEDTVFLVAGDGPLRPDLERLAAENNLSGRLYMVGERRDIQMIMPCLDVFVLASVTEGLPLTVLEAMAARRPVVATRVGGIPEVVSDGINGVLVSPGDVRGMAGAIIGLLEDPAGSGIMGEEGRNLVVGQFTVKKMVKSTENVYLDLALKGKSRGLLMV